ncbi:reverse transcriptase domain-containing protein [Tanacetum coccineum]
MVDEHHKEAQKASTSKGAESLIYDATCNETENESSSNSEGLNFREFTEEETKNLYRDDGGEFMEYEAFYGLFVGWPAAASRGGGTGGQTGRGGGRTGGRSGNQSDGRNEGQGGQVGGQGREVNDGVDRVPDFSTIIAQQLQNLLPTIVVQVGDQGRGQGIGRNQNGNAANDHIQGDVGNVIKNNDRKGCTYKEFLACNPKEYDGKGGAVVYTYWIEKMESALTWWNFHIRTLGREVAVGMSWDKFKALTREKFCPSNEMQKLVPHLVTPRNIMIKRYEYGLAPQIRGMVAATEPKTIQKAMQIFGTLTDEALMNGQSKKNPEKRGNGGEPSKDRNVRDDNKRTRTRNAFATTTNPVVRENTSTVPKCNICNTHHLPEAPYGTRFNYKRPGHFAKDCRVAPRNVNPINSRNLTIRACYECGSTDHIRSACPRLNRAQGLGGNSPNQALANNRGQGRGNQARVRAFMLGAEEARQDPNIVTGTFTLNDHYATTLFNFGVDYSFVSTTFIPLLGIEPSDLGFNYEIEIASGQLVEIDKVIRGCKLEIEGHVFDINSIPFGSGIFDVIIGMD